MGKKPNDMLVSRELLERLFSDEPDGYVTRMNARQELLALLAQPADQQGGPAGWAHENGLKELQERKSGTWPFITCLSSHKSPVDGVTVALYRHAQPATAKVDENAEFYKWRDEQCASLERIGYTDAAKKFRELGSIHWAGWQARAKLNGGQS